MKFVPDSVLDYVLKAVWRGAKDIVFVSNFEIAKKYYINRCASLVDKLLKENDAVVIFKEYIAFYKDMLCGLCNYDGEIILPREFKEILVLDDDDKPEYVETIKEGNTNIYSISAKKFILPNNEYDDACVYELGISVMKNGLRGAVNLQGEVIFLCEYDDIWEERSPFPHYFAKKDGWIEIFDEKANLLTNEKFSSLHEATKKIYEMAK